MYTIFKKKSVLVTGGAGFIGSHIVKRLVELDAKVVVVDNLYSGNLKNLKEVFSEIEFFKIDIRNKRKLEKIFRNFKVVFHQAALRSVPQSMDNPQEFIEVNIKGTYNILELCSKFKVKLFVNASSSSVYGESKKFPQSEKDNILPVSFYAFTKLSTEHMSYIFHRFRGVNTVSLRYFNVYGPYQSLESKYAMVIPKFITCFLKDEPCPVFGDGRQSRDFTYISDVVEANLLCVVQQRSWGKVFNIAGGKSYSVLKIYNYLKKFTSKDVSINFLPPRPGDVRKTEADLSFAKKYLKYYPKVSFEEGLKKTLKWFDENRWFWR